MIIIGLSAKKQGGKSTFIEYVQKNIPGSAVVRFADSLKQIVLDCFVPREWKWNSPDDLDLDEHKNTMLPCGQTVRQMLQIIGTDWFRHTWEECWINAYKKKIYKMYSYSSKLQPTVILTPDVRFPNELKVIQEMGGIVIRLLRAPFGEQDQHESEIALDKAEENSLSMIYALRKGIEEKFGNIVATKSLLNPFLLHDVYEKGRGKFFDAIFDNRTMTLEDTQIWIKNHFMKCFSWNEEQEGISNMKFNLMRLIDEN